MTRARRMNEKSATFIYFYLLTGAIGRTGADGAERKKGVVDALVGEIQLRLKTQSQAKEKTPVNPPLALGSTIENKKR